MATELSHMRRQIDVVLNGTRIPIDEAVFTVLLENSVAANYNNYKNALESFSITFDSLVALARTGDIPYVLFFAPLPVAESQVRSKTEKLLAGVTKETFSVNSRDRVHLRDIELIVKDLLRKQELLKRSDSTLIRNRIVGLLSRPGRTPEDDAATLMEALGLSHDAIRTARSKADALEVVTARLEANQVLVSRGVPNAMPQNLTKVKGNFSGMAIRDAKVPYIFLAGGNRGDSEEPAGRMVFTLVLMAVLVAQKKFMPVTYDGSSAGTDVGPEYDIVGAILMPAETLRGLPLGVLDDVKAAADVLHVTPSAIAVRAMRLGVISPAAADAHLQELRREFSQRPRSQARTLGTVKAVRRYNGREFSRRMLEVLDAGRISRGEFCRVVCLRRIRPHQINAFREVVL
jgi:hypothetical protein